MTLLTQAARRFVTLPPLAKVGVWLLAIVLCATIVQAAALLLGSSLNMVQPSGASRSILIVIGLASVMLIMQIDRRPPAEYGLAMRGDWLRRAGLGFMIGLATYSAYYVLAAQFGAVIWNTQQLTAGVCLSAAASALGSLFVAVIQQVIFNGYLLGILRTRHSRATSVLVTALLFAVFAQMHNLANVVRGTDVALFAGFFLIATMLALLCLRTGSITLSSGLLAGWLVVRRLISKTGLVTAALDSPSADLLLPAGDPRRSPVLWLLLGAATAACVWVLIRYGEQKPAQDRTGLDTQFKRLFPLSNVMGLTPVDLWLGRLMDARFHVGLVYLPRMLAILAASTVNMLLTLPERWLAPLLIRHEVPDPVFIIGVHRSGTTHLHNLLSLDGRFCTPRNYQTMNPLGMISWSWLLTPLLGLFMNVRRPMDAVKITALSPQEEEFALAGMSRMSPYWAFSFPARYAAYRRFLLSEGFTRSEMRRWQHDYLLFLRKLTFWRRKQPLLKNPCNTGRVAALREMFPRAKFVHIRRHPYDVYRSNMHLAREGFIVLQVQDPDPSDSYATWFLQNYREMESAYSRDVQGLPPGDVAEVRFDDLESDPQATIRSIYAQLGLEFTPAMQSRLADYLQSVKGYQKNRFHNLPAETKAEIDLALAPLLERWNYADRAA